MIKPLHKLVGEHKDIVKIVIQLQSIVSTIKPEVQELLDQFSKYRELWDMVSSSLGVQVAHVIKIKKIKKSEHQPLYIMSSFLASVL